uniref:Uncharacterized protein n=1 Tax=Amphimedon queenslandica TaxID=400682 RepID=A0A1X7UTT4_AMPQE
MKDIVPVDTVALEKNIEMLRTELDEGNARVDELLLKLCTYTNSTEVNKGKGIDEVGERQQRQKITALKEASKKALWFLDSFNVDVNNLILRTKISKEAITLMLSDESSDYDHSQGLNESSEVSSTSVSQSEKIDEILFLLNCFGVSDEFYHELSMYHPSLPRSYFIKERRRLVSSNVEINRLSHPYFGCYRPLADSMKEILSNLVSHLI